MKEVKLLDMGIKPIISRTKDGKKIRGDRIHAGNLMPLIDQLLSYKTTAIALGFKREGSLVLEESSRQSSVQLESIWTREGLLQQDGWTLSFARPTSSLNTRSWMGVGHEQELREEEPELDRAEDRVEDHAQVNADLGEPECYYFEEYEAPRMNPSVVAAHKRIGLLQRFNKWQGKAMDKMQKSMDKMSRSLLTTPRRLPAQKPHRAYSSRLGKEETTRRGGGRVPERRSNSINELDRAQGRVDLEEPLFENPDSSTAPYQDFPQSHWTPYNRFERAQLHQGQGSHTHFNEEEEEEEEADPQARSSDVNPAEWSVPDGRLPSPDHDLASHIFGGH
ncbi:unnamed protein product [Microthlaspi erraticum]|uniref:Arabidopsis retrotransposon Orf1 C-terminal domain-containing protein n=1 Tax=Microthlaspi erraticum TaxID=1685480 RepID=A0A6D2ILU9_9BRAS|nr:unnamed protein product [Microthlaspi erraticum]